MFILRDLLSPLQAEFSNTAQGQKRKVWFAYTLLAVVLPFTSSISSNLLRALRTLFGIELKSQRFYAFMASPTLPWKRLWHAMWGMIPSPAVEEERIMVALDDSINPKSGRKILELLQGLNEKYKTTLIMVTHNPNISVSSDTIYFITI